MKVAKIFKKYSFLIGVFLFIFILLRLDFGYYGELINKIHLSGFLTISAIVLFVFLPSIFFNPLRWQRLMRTQGIHYSFWQAFLMYEASIYIGMFTPGRIGEASRFFYLKKDHPAGKAFVSIILDRMADIIFLLSFAYFGMFLFLDILKKEILIFSVIASSLLFLVILIWKSRLLKYFLQKIFYYFIPQKYRDSWKINFQDFFRGLYSYKFADYAFAFFLTIIIWFLFYVSVYLFAREIGVNIPFFYFSSAIALSSLAAFLPISVAGLGTRDAVLLAMFSFFNVPAELTIAVSMFILFLTFVLSVVGLFSWIKKPLEI